MDKPFHQTFSKYFYTHNLVCNCKNLSAGVDSPVTAFLWFICKRNLVLFAMKKEADS